MFGITCFLQSEAVTVTECLCDCVFVVASMPPLGLLWLWVLVRSHLSRCLALWNDSLKYLYLYVCTYVCTCILNVFCSAIWFKGESQPGGGGLCDSLHSVYVAFLVTRECNARLLSVKFESNVYNPLWYGSLMVMLHTTTYVDWTCLENVRRPAYMYIYVFVTHLPCTPLVSLV